MLRSKKDFVEFFLLTFSRGYQKCRIYFELKHVNKEQEAALCVLEFSRLYTVITYGYKMYIDEFFPFVVLIAMWLFGGDHSLTMAFNMFGIILVSAGLFYGVVAGKNIFMGNNGTTAIRI